MPQGVPPALPQRGQCAVQCVNAFPPRKPAPLEAEGSFPAEARGARQLSSGPIERTDTLLVCAHAGALRVRVWCEVQGAGSCGTRPSGPTRSPWTRAPPRCTTCGHSCCWLCRVGGRPVGACDCMGSAACALGGGGWGCKSRRYSDSQVSRLQPWSPGPLVPWSPGPLVPWSPPPKHTRTHTLCPHICRPGSRCRADHRALLPCPLLPVESLRAGGGGGQGKGVGGWGGVWRGGGLGCVCMLRYHV